MTDLPRTEEPEAEDLEAAEPTPARSTIARIAWGVLIFLIAGFAINHVVGVATYADTDTDRLLLTVFAALNVYALIVLLIPYRNRVPWAWGVTWVSVAVFAITPLLVEPPIGWFYLGAAVVLAAAQLAALPDFRRG